MAKKTKSKQLAFAEIGRRGKPKTARVKRRTQRVEKKATVLTKRERSMSIADVKIGTRHRKDMGDIAGLAASIAEVGLLHPIVVRPDGVLIAGQRRIEAFKALARTEIPVTVVDIASIVRGEYAENTERKDFTWSEAVDIKRAIEPEQKAAAKERKGARTDLLEGKLPAGSKRRSEKRARDHIAKATGKKARTLEKAGAVVAAAEADPEKFGHLPTQMDETGKVEPAFKEMQIIKARAEYEERAEPGGKVEDLHALVASGKRFAVILADPPWSFEVFSGKGKQRSAESHYDTMSLDDIKALPIAQLAADDCALFLWGVCPEVPGALDVIKAWGFEFKTKAFTWVKTTPSAEVVKLDGDGLHWGMGYWTRANSEDVWLATIGSPQRLAMDVHQVIVAPVGEHSQKPDETHKRIESLLAGPYLELFARAERPGWTTWGNEVKAPIKIEGSDEQPDAKPLEAAE